MTWLIVGLGNPGTRYAATRHNIGYRVCDALVARVAGSWKKHKSGLADVVEGRLAGQRVILARPRTFMNESGGPVSALAKFYRVEPDHTVAIHDELDLDFGQLRLKLGGGDNGHNGLKSMRQSLGSGDFYRVRVGVGRPPGRQDVKDFVLSSYSVAERKEVDGYVEEAADAIELLLEQGLAASQSAFNR